MFLWAVVVGDLEVYFGVIRGEAFYPVPLFEFLDCIYFILTSLDHCIYMGLSKGNDVTSCEIIDILGHEEWPIRIKHGHKWGILVRCLGRMPSLIL